MSDITVNQDANPTSAAVPAEKPDVDTLFGAKDVDDLFPADYKPGDSTGFFARNNSPVHDFLFANPGRANAHILDAFGYGFKQDWGAGQQQFSEADDYLRKAGIYNDYAKGQRSIIKAANEMIMRPAVAAIVAAKSAFGGLFHGAQEAVAQTGEEYGAPILGREIASIPEVFPAGVHQMAGIPHLPEPIAQAKSLDVIGAGEAGYFGTTPARPTETVMKIKGNEFPMQEGAAGPTPIAEPPSPVAQSTSALAEAPAPAAEMPAPDIHAVARQIAPDTFNEFDALQQKKDTFRRWIDELRTTRDEDVRASAPHADEIANLDDQIANQQAKKGGYGKLQSLNAKRDALTSERDDYIAEHTQGDSADMAKIRQQLMETDYRMRDLAPDVTKAYREAELRMPQAETAPPLPEPTNEEAPASIAREEASPVGESAPVSGEEVGAQGETQAEVKPLSHAPIAQQNESQPAPPVQPAATLPIAHAPSIVADVTQKLQAAGRPAEEADAAAQVVAAYWETRSARFEGRKGTAAEMYAREAPEIVAGKTREKQASREMEMAQTVTRQGRIRIRDDARNTITLLKNADASTFIHETGHDWLDRMLDDAEDPEAPETLRSDAQTVLKWLGTDSPEGVKTRHHEKFARGFETYMMEGRAPSSALARVFAKFKTWLTTIYKTVAALKAPISDDIRGVFDRLLAEKPEKTVIAPEQEAKSPLAEAHEALVESTPPERAFDVANTVEGERDSHAAANQLKENDERLADTGSQAEGRAARGAQPSGPADEARPVAGEAETAGRSGAVGAGGSETAPEGHRARQKSIGPVSKPTPLLRFIASRGGIAANDELIGDLRQLLGANNRYIPGHGQLIRAAKQISTSAKRAGRFAAMPLDTAREAAVEAGLLPEGATVRDLLDRIDDEVRGLASGREVTAEENAHAEHNFIESVNDIAKEGGGSELTEAERIRALELHKAEGLNDPHDILERFSLEARDAEIGPDFAPNIENVPGWDVVAPGWDEIPADSRAASDHGGSAAPAESGEPGGATARSSGPGQNEGRAPLDPTADLPRSESQLIDKAGNIRLDNLGTPEDVNAVIRATAQELEPYNEAITRGRISDAEVLKLADALGMDAAQLSERKLGQAFNAEQIVAARKLLIQSASNVRDLAAKIGGGTEADVLAYAQARARHLMIQEQVSGLTAEAGRALRAFRSMAGSKEAADISAFLKNTQGKTLYQMKEEGALLAMMGTPQQVSKAVHEANLTRWQKTRQGILSWFINNLISGPVTHAGYSIGNTVVQLFKATVDTSVAAAIGALRDAPAGERVYMGEVGAQLYGMVRGMRDGFAPALTALKTGVPYMKGDVDGMIGQIEAAHRPQAIPGKFGYVMETPSRAVTAIHTMHYSMNYEAEIARRAFRSAMTDGLDPGSDTFNRKVAEFTQSPPSAEMEAAHDEAMKMVLMKSAQFGTAQYHLQKAVNSNILAKIVMPFMQVGANILHESFIERTPIGAMSQTVRDNLSGKNGAVARDSQAARIGIGIGVSTAIVGLAAEGLITGGGPSDPKQLAVKEMTGWKPYSIKVGEFYVPYRKYLGGLGPLIAGTADMYEVGHALNEEGLTKAAASSLFGFAEVIADESWARGLANFIDAARHWDRDGGRYLRNLAADFIPFSIGLQQVTTLTDPYRREVRSMLDVARAHIPGLSQGLYPVRDIWGEPIESHTALGPARANHDPATQALLDAGYYPAQLQRKIRGVELSDQQYDDLTRIAGRMARMRVNALASTPGFALLPKQVQADKLRDIITSTRESARSMILMQNTDIIQKASAAKTAKLSGQPVH